MVDVSWAAARRGADARGVHDELEVSDVVALMRAARDRVDRARERLGRARDLARVDATPRRLTEFRRAQEAVTGALYDRAMLHTFWATQARQKEIRTATWRYGAWRRSGAFIFDVLGKGAKGSGPRVRTVGLGPEDGGILREYALVAFGELPADGFIFPGRDGAPISASGAEDVLDRLTRAAGVQRIKDPNRKTHRNIVTWKAIRACSESFAVFQRKEDPALVAAGGGHTEEVQKRHYLKLPPHLVEHLATQRQLTY